MLEPLGSLALAVLLAIFAVIYGIFAGKAKARRMQALRDELKLGRNTRYYAIGGAVLLVLLSLIF